MLKHIEDVMLPNALMIGVDYDLFWTLNPKSLSPFVKAFSLKQKYDDATAWRTGMYIRLAIASSMDKNSKYPSKPMLEEGSVKQSNTMTAEQIKNKMMARAKLINSRFGKED